jgi:hypothetical protein
MKTTALVTALMLAATATAFADYNDCGRCNYKRSRDVTWCNRQPTVAMQNHCLNLAATLWVRCQNSCRPWGQPRGTATH